MRIVAVKVSGFRPIPFCADYDADTPSIIWNNPFEVTFPTEFIPQGDGPLDWSAGNVLLENHDVRKLLGALIGANSSGKSSVLYALDAFFSAPNKLPEDSYNEKDCTRPVIIEVSAVGFIGDPQSLSCVGTASNQVVDMQAWIDEHCEHLTVQGIPERHLYRLTVAVVWCNDNSRIAYIRKPDGSYVKVTPKLKNAYETLFPKYRLLSASNSLDTELNAEKQTLMGDLFLEVIEQQKSKERSLFNRIDRRLGDLTELLEHASDQLGGKTIKDLEEELSTGLVSVNPNASVRFDLNKKLPSAEQLFKSSHPLINDGVEIDPRQHGLGMQRSFVLATLNAWCDIVGHKNDNIDYFFAIEEPEIYLHPHAIRVMLGTLEHIAKHDQVIFTTHASEFVNRVPLPNVTRICRTNHGSYATQPDLSGISSGELSKIQRFLVEDRSDMLFARSVLLVEGQSELFSFPSFAQKLGIDLDRNGVSIVCTNGKGNFDVYHQILDAFGIPYVIFGDGDGNQAGHSQRYSGFTRANDRVFVIEEDFEYLLVATYPQERILAILNACLVRQGREMVEELPTLQIAPGSIKSDWWDDLKDNINNFILPEHRHNYDTHKQQIQSILNTLASEIVANGHMTPTAQYKRWTRYLVKKATKPLVGRVAGELFNKHEVEQLTLIVQALQKSVELAQI